MNKSPIAKRIWQEVEIGHVESHRFCEGQLLSFSQRCPTRSDTPNEDSACFLEVASNAGFIAVADGVGGANAGDRASQCVVRHLIHACENLTLTDLHGTRGLRSEILDGIEAANQEILAWGIGAGSTLTAVEYFDGWIRTYHVGDSGAILTSNRGRIKFATVGHAPIAQAVEIGLIDEREALIHEDRNVITNCLGSDTMKIEIGPAMKMAPRDTLLIASDGLLDNVTCEAIAASICKGDFLTQVTSLTNLARSRMVSFSSGTPSKPDDITLVGFRKSAPAS